MKLVYFLIVLATNLGVCLSASGLDSAPTAKIKDLAMHAIRCAEAKGVIHAPRYLAIIDYSRPSTAKRFWLVDLKDGALLFSELVAHGKNTGDNYAKHFSNSPRSLQSSLGLFRAGKTYEGENGHSLILHGLEPGINDRAEERRLVIHGAGYVNEEFIRKVGRLGRSWGCPALPQRVARAVIDRMSEQAVLFAYADERAWLTASRYLKECRL